MVFCIAIGSVHLVHAFTLDRIVEYREVSFTSPRWPEELSGYVIALITDVHAFPNEQLAQLVIELNSRNIDLVLLGGDFSTLGNRYRESLGILSEIEARDGIFGVEGNHDDYVMLFASMEANGIVPLSNSGVRIHESFFLAGLPDLWNRREIVSIYEAVSEADPYDFVLLLSHNPDVTMQQPTHAVDMVLSGHTHGGHITFFGVWAPFLTFSRSVSYYGQHFMTGWSMSRDGVPVYVSNGLGGYNSIPRVFARPQVILITMQHGDTLETNVYVSFLLSGFGIMVMFFITWNIFTFALFANDKKRAEKDKTRIGETALISYSFLLGGPGAYLSMRVFRHKTDKIKFKLLIPLSIIVDFAVLSFLAFMVRQDFISDIIRMLWSLI